MSFSGEVKKELLSVMPKARHCVLAELSAMIYFMSREAERREGRLCLRSENEAVLEKCFTLLKKAFNIEFVSTKSSHMVTVDDPKTVSDILHAAMSHSVLNLECCRRAFLRGAFLTSGSISAPEKYYHFEVVSSELHGAEVLQNVMQSFMLDAKIVLRKKDYVVYLKEGEQIVTVLGEMGASVSFLNLESIRVMKEMRGSVNRRVNCETANLNKTIISSVRQVEDIRYIESHGGLNSLKPQLREMAEVRLRYPDTPLASLGQYLDPPIGKSGVNHRLKKLSEIAEALRDI